MTSRAGERRRRAARIDPCNTFKRLWYSNHVDDLRLVAVAAVVLAVALALVSFRLWSEAVQPDGSKGTSLVSSPVITGWTAIAVFLLTLTSWCYQTASRRLGVIDLFASEISTICRICLIADFAENSLTWQRNSFPRFTSEEKYTPAYDEQIGDLYSLDYHVVTSVTEFYTYRKAMRDYLRRLGSAEDDKQFAAYLLSMNYMQFLMYESGRKAVAGLMEFEPWQTESSLNAFCSELTLLPYLIANFQGDDFRGRRLKLRVDEYQRVLAGFCALDLDSGDAAIWRKTAALLPEAQRRFDEAKKAFGGAKLI